MNFVTHILSDSVERMRRIQNGKVSLEQASAEQREFEAQVKMYMGLVSMFGVASKNRRTFAMLEKMNIMDDSTAIDLMLGDPETDKVKCPLRDDLITRAECLDYSGSHGDDCRGCEIGRATKAKLLPPVV